MEEEEEPAVWARRGAQRRSISRYSRQILFIASQRRHKKGECRLTAPFSFSRKGRPYQAALIKDPFTCPSLLFPLPPSPKYERKVETRRSKRRKYLDRKNDDGRGKKGSPTSFPIFLPRQQMLLFVLLLPSLMWRRTRGRVFSFFFFFPPGGKGVVVFQPFFLQRGMYLLRQRGPLRLVSVT